MPRLDCGWTIPANERAQIILMLKDWTPATEEEQRDKHILQLAFIEDMNAAQIARLQDPVIVGLGNRSRGKPLSVTSILKICYKYAPASAQRTKPKNKAAREKRLELIKARESAGVSRPTVCSTCGADKDIELHHIIPIAAGGTNDYYNLINLCHDCHMMLHHHLYNAIKWDISI